MTRRRAACVAVVVALVAFAPVRAAAEARPQRVECFAILRSFIGQAAPTRATCRPVLPLVRGLRDGRRFLILGGQDT